MFNIDLMLLHGISYSLTFNVVAWDFLMLNIQCCCMGFPNV